MFDETKCCTRHNPRKALRKKFCDHVFCPVVANHIREKRLKIIDRSLPNTYIQWDEVERSFIVNTNNKESAMTDNISNQMAEAHLMDAGDKVVVTTVVDKEQLEKQLERTGEFVQTTQDVGEEDENLNV